MHCFREKRNSVRRASCVVRRASCVVRRASCVVRPGFLLKEFIRNEMTHRFLFLLSSVLCSSKSFSLIVLHCRFNGKTRYNGARRNREKNSLSINDFSHTSKIRTCSGVKISTSHQCRQYCNSIFYNGFKKGNKTE